MKKLLVTLLATGILAQNVCYADVQVAMRKNGTIIVDGSVDFGEQAYAADMTVSAYDPDGNLNYMDVIALPKTGKAEFSYYNLGKDGNYTYKFSVPALSISETYTLTDFIGNDHWTAFCGNMNTLIANGSTTETLRDTFMAEKDNLSLDLTEYNALSNGLDVFEVLKNDAQNGYASTEAIVNSFYAAISFCTLKSDGDMQKYYSNSRVNMNGYLPQSADGSGISVLDSLSGTAKQAVFDAVKADVSTFSGNNALKTRLLNDILFVGIEKAESYKDVQKLLNAYIDAGYLNVEKDMPEGVYKALTNVKYSQNTEIETAVLVAKNQLNQSAVSSPSGGGSGGSGGGGIASLPAVNPPVSVKDNLQSGEMVFKDMEDAKWALTAVENLYRKNIVSGMGDGNFCPHNKVKREEMAKMLVDLIGYGKNVTDIPFADADASSWSYPYICAAYANAIISGISPDEFGVGREITRELAVALVYRALKNINIEMPGTDFRFDDDDQISDWAKDAVYGLYSIGVIGGKSASEFAPKDSMSRVEAAVLLNGVIKYFDGGNA